MSERTTVRLPQELLERAKRKAAADGRTLTSLIEDGLRIVVAQAPKRAAQLPRVSTAKGGVAPGIDLDDFSAVQEFDDLTYVRKLRRGE